MRILHILNHVNKSGNGIVNVAVDLACLAAKSGHQVGVASAGGGYEELLAHYGIRHYQLDQTRKPINLLKAASHYRTIVRDFQLDIVHAHMMTGIVLACTLKAGFRYALVSTVHNEFQKSSILMGWADRVIAVSNAVDRSMIRRGIPKKKLRVINNGTVGSPRTRPLKDYIPMSLQRPAIATVAGMYRRKGIGDLIDAFVKIAPDFPDAHLYLVGDGPERTIFEEQAQNTIIVDRIHFEGFQREPQRYLLATDIFVLASHCDSSPLVIPEAREAGCAIIGTDVDGIPEALNGGEAGLLVPPHDSSTLAKAIAQLLSQPKELYRWKEQARHNLDYLTAARVAEETLALYSELIPEYYTP
jgi:glycosyltransferase involved in cell wall biosynthesis